MRIAAMRPAAACVLLDSSEPSSWSRSEPAPPPLAAPRFTFAQTFSKPPRKLRRYKIQVSSLSKRNSNRFTKRAFSRYSRVPIQRIRLHRVHSRTTRQKRCKRTSRTKRNPCCACVCNRMWRLKARFHRQTPTGSARQTPCKSWKPFQRYVLFFFSFFYFVVFEFFRFNPPDWLSFKTSA